MATDVETTTYTTARLGAHELVLLHGQPGSAVDWLQVTGRLPAQFHAVAADRPGYGSSRRPAGGFAANARAVLDDLDARGIRRAVLVGHSYGGGVALVAASLAPHRVEAVVLLASVGPGCVNGWDRLLAAPGAGPLCALVAWRLTPWIARARLAHIGRSRGRPLRQDEYVNWQVWAEAGRGRGPVWRTFLAEQRALLRELGGLDYAIGSVQAPVLLLADPNDTVVPVDTARGLARALPDARLQLVEGAGHHLPRRVPDVVAEAIVAFVAEVGADHPDLEHQDLDRYGVRVGAEPRSAARASRPGGPVRLRSGVIEPVERRLDELLLVVVAAGQRCGTRREARARALMPSGSTTSVSITATAVAAPSAPGGQWKGDRAVRPASAHVSEPDTPTRRLRLSCADRGPRSGYVPVCRWRSSARSVAG